MSWIDDRLSEQKKREEDSALIREHAESIYNDLWNEITGWLKEAKEKGIPVGTNGAPHRRIVWRSRETGGNRIELKINLEKEKGEISISGGGISKLLLSVCDDGVVCLKHDGAQISIHDAAIAILDRFLFPDLPSTSRTPTNPRGNTNMSGI